jgi:iron complex outermembrane receptor protein
VFLRTLLLALLATDLLWAQQAPQTVATHTETVVVTGTAQPVPLDDADRSVSSFEVRELPLLAASPADYLRQDPAIDVRERAPNLVQADVSVRGASFGQTLVLVNGLRMNDPQSGHHNFDTPLPLVSIDRIEVLRGAGSTLYGSDAVGGAVNFIVAPPPETELRLGAAAGNFGINQQNASLSYAARRWGEQLGFGRDFSTGFAPDRDYRSLTVASNTRLDSRLGHTAILLALSDRPFGADQFYGNFNSWERTKSWFASLAADAGHNTQVAFAFRRHTDLFVLKRDDPAAFVSQHEAQSWQAALRRHHRIRGNTTVSYGAEGYRDSIESSNLGRHARNQGAGYVNLDVRAIRRFSFSAGAREDVYSGSRSVFSPSVSGGAWLTARLKVRASASRAFRLPSYTDLYYHDPANLGSPNLRPESAWSFETGGEWNGNGRLATGVTLFHMRERDGIDYLRSTANDIWRAANIQKLNFTGAETFLRVRLPHAQRLTFAYSYLYGVQEALMGLQSKYAFNYPTHNGVVTWEGVLFGQVAARSRLGTTQRYGRDPYAVCDVAVARASGRVQPFVRVANLANLSYQEIAGIQMPGRTVTAGFEVVLARGKPAADANPSRGN